LKQFGENGKTDISLLEVLDEQMQQPANYIWEQRKDYTSSLIPLVQKFYLQIAGKDELIALNYDSQLNKSNFDYLLRQNREKDILLQRTNAGIHKDEITITLGSQGFKNIASQGQRKSLLFALKLAEFEQLKNNKGFAPILLLDDIFEKLDDSRMQNLLHWVCNENNGQVIITDTHKERLVAALKGVEVAYQLIELQ
jgi:DNA replication and repair protein RecF